jgi:hypothetical protein
MIWVSMRWGVRMKQRKFLPSNGVFVNLNKKEDKMERGEDKEFDDRVLVSPLILSLELNYEA